MLISSSRLKTCLLFIHLYTHLHLNRFLYLHLNLNLFFLNKKLTSMKRSSISKKKVFDIKLFDEFCFSFTSKANIDIKTTLLLKREMFLIIRFNFLRCKLKAAYSKKRSFNDFRKFDR